MTDVLNLQRIIAVTEESVRAGQEELGVLRRQLINAIKAGDTTGDLIRDYLTVTHGGVVPPEREKILRDITDQLRNKSGELVMVQVTLVIREGESGYFGSEPDETESLALLGMLGGETLVLNCADPQCALPTGGKYIVFQNHSNEIKLMEGNIPLVSHFDADLAGRNSAIYYWNIFDHTPQVELIIGTELVLVHLHFNGLLLVDTALRMLGVETGREDLLKAREEFILVYQRDFNLELARLNVLKAELAATIIMPIGDRERCLKKFEASVGELRARVAKSVDKVKAYHLENDPALAPLIAQLHDALAKIESPLLP